MQPRIYVHHDLAELRCPARSFVRARHEAAMMMDGFEQRDLEAIARIEHAIAAITESRGPVLADMRERRHEIRRSRSADTALLRHEVEIADIFH